MVHSPTHRSAPLPDDGALEAYERNVGIQAHALIGALCGDVDQAATAPSLMARARRQLLAHPVRRGRQATIQRITFAALTYLRELIPAPRHAYDFLGAEFAVGSCRVDLAWCGAHPMTNAAGTVFFDELKCASWRGDVASRDRRQVDAAIAAGAQTFGSVFGGVRFLNLTDPRGRFWVFPDGRWEAIPADGRGVER